MDLRAYLDRIGFAGVPRPDLATLRAIHRGHSLSISYENLDVQLGRPLTTSPASVFVMTAIAQRHMGDEIRLLRGRAFRRLRGSEKEDSLIDTADDFVALLKREFELDVPEAAGIWDRVCARRDELFAQAST